MWRRFAVLGPVVSALVLAVSACTIGVSQPATSLTDTSASLHGEIFSTSAGEVDYWFRYGTTTDYGQETPRRTISLTGEDHKAVSEPIQGLTAETTYHFALCVQHRSRDPDRVVCYRDGTLRTEPAEPTELSVSAQPDLYPSFTPEATDYVVRCGGDPIAVDVAAPDSTLVGVDGQAPRTGRFSKDVAVADGEGFSFTTETGGHTLTYHVRCLPADFPTWTFSRSGAPSQDWTLLALSKGNGRFVTFVDRFGVPVWWFRHIRIPLDASLLPDDTVAYARGEATPFGGDDTAYEIRKLDGTLVRTLTTVGSGTDHHELQQLPNGNYLILTYKARNQVDLSAHGGPSDATVLDAEIQELTPAGTLVWTWNSKDHIPLSDTGPWWPSVISQAQTPVGRGAHDIVHINAVEPDGSGLLISLRHTDAVYRIRRSDGGVDWKLGGIATNQSLTVSGDSGPTFSGQHDVRRLSDGTVTVYDNATQLGRPPRAVRFGIDLEAKHATRLESVRDPDVTASLCCGSARKLTSGGWLIGWGSISSPVIGEYTNTGAQVFKLRYPDAFSYRAVPVPPGRISGTALRQGMNAMFPRTSAGDLPASAKPGD